jgi:hypothetical protein
MLGQSGWGVLVLGVVVSWFFVSNSELWAPILFSAPTDRTQGRVTGAEGTNMFENDARIYAIHYAYVWNGTSHEGVSYGLSSRPGPGETVHVELVASSPKVSRIVGFRYRAFGASAGLTLIMPLVGLGMVVDSIRRGQLKIGLLARGHATWGTLVNKRATDLKINDTPVYELTFRFRDRDGREQQGAIRTLHTAPMEDEPHERLLYDPHRPQHVLLLDDLGRDVRVDERGRLVAQRGSLLVLLLPILTCTAILAFLLMGS